MKNLKKSEILEMFEKIKDYGFNEFDNRIFWVEIPYITGEETRKLGNNILCIHPWDDNSIKISIDNVIDD